MTINNEAIQTAHAAICEENFDDCLEWRGKCVKAVEAAAPSIRAEALEAAAANILTNDPLDYWSQHLPEGLGFQSAMSSWLKAHAKAERAGQ